MAETKPKLLIVEDDEGLQAQLKWAYEDFDVILADTRETAVAAVRAEEPAVVTLDLGLPPDPDGTSEGFAVLEAIMAIKPDTKVIVASGHGARESALRAVEEGAYDFYQKPVDIDTLGLIVQRAYRLHQIESENRRLAEQIGDERTVLGSMITAAPEMAKVARTIERVAPTNVSVMLLGASGTGKELLARGVHDCSVRKDGSFVAINCAAIPENLLESELFGHEKGAFTGAVKTTPGKIELADGGTLFLDEVGDIPLPLQVKLLRFLQERTIERVGGRKAISVDTRIVCATHQDLEAMIGAGTFADNASCAVSATGDGEAYLRLSVAHEIDARMRLLGQDIGRAAEAVVMQDLVRIGGSGGLIAVDHTGAISMPFNCEGMYRAQIREGQGRETAIY